MGFRSGRVLRRTSILGASLSASKFLQEATAFSDSFFAGVNVTSDLRQPSADHYVVDPDCLQKC
jgi:hypothetical protein